MPWRLIVYYSNTSRCAVIIPPPLGRSSYDVVRASAGSMSAVDTRFVGRRTAFLFVAGGNVRSRACRVGMMKGCYSV